MTIESEKNAPTARATLADAQPGGRVRLGDQAERAQFEAWAAEHKYSVAMDGEQYEFAAARLLWKAWRAAFASGAAAAVTGTVLVNMGDSEAEFIRANDEEAALSAQPSPGGQDAQRIIVRIAGVGQCTLTVNDGAIDVPAETIAGLAARQPDALAYEGHSWVSDYVLADLRERAALPLQLRNGEVWHWQGDGHDFPESLICPVVMSAETLRALLATLQPVGESDACLLPQIATERMLDAGWPCGEMIDRTFDRQGAYADLVAAAPARARQPVGQIPAGFVLVPEKFGIPADVWEGVEFVIGGPGTGEGEAYLDSTAWIGDLIQDDGSSIYGLHLSCDECPEEGSVTLSEFTARAEVQP